MFNPIKILFFLCLAISVSSLCLTEIALAETTSVTAQVKKNATIKKTVKTINKHKTVRRKKAIKHPIAHKSRKKVRHVSVVHKKKTTIVTNQPKPVIHNIAKPQTPLYALTEVEKRLVHYIHDLIKSMQFSKYGYGSDHIDTDKGIYIVDCSRYVDFIMKKLYPNAYDTLVNISQSEKPTSYDYFQCFNELPNKNLDYWNAIENVETLRPGDILVFRYDTKKGERGHVMIVMDTPKRDGDTFSLQIADSAPNAHSKDSRPRKVSGIGIGTLLLKVDPKTKEPLAYAWSRGSKWNDNVNIAMGRPTLSG